MSFQTTAIIPTGYPSLCLLITEIRRDGTPISQNEYLLDCHRSNSQSFQLAPSASMYNVKITNLQLFPKGATHLFFDETYPSSRPSNRFADCQLFTDVAVSPTTTSVRFSLISLALNLSNAELVKLGLF